MSDAFDAIIEAAGQKYNVDPRLIKTGMMLESSGNPNVGKSLPNDPDSPDGLMQIRPSTGRAMGATDVRVPEQAIDAGARYIREGLDKTGTPEGALAYYHAGPDTSGWGPKTAAHVARGVALYPQIKVNGQMAQAQTTQSTASDADAIFDRYLKASSSPASDVAATQGEKAGTAAPPSNDNADAIFDRYLKATIKPAPPPPIQAQNPDNPAEVLTGPNTSVEGTAPQQGTGGIPQDVVDTAKRVGAAMASPWQEGSEWARKADELATALPSVFGDTPMGRTNRLMVALPMQALEAGGKGVQSLARGAGALAGSVASAHGDTSSNRLERDISQIGDVAGVLSGAVPGSAMRGNKLAGPEMAAREVAPGVPALTPAFDRLPAAVETQKADLLRAFVNGEIPRDQYMSAVAELDRPRTAPEPLPVGAATANHGPPAPESVGAAATPAEIAGIGKAEAAAYLRSDNGKKLMEPQRVNEADRTQYVPGAIATEAEQTQNPQLARADRDLLRQPGSDARTIMEARLQHNNDMVNNQLEVLAGNPVSVLRMQEARGEELRSQLAPVFAKAKEANLEPIHAAIQKVLDGPSAVKTPVENALNSVKTRMDKFGDKMKNPEFLWNLRQHIDELIKHNGSTDAPQSWLAAKELNGVRDVVTKQIEEAAPGFKQMSEDYAKATAEIKGKQYILDNMSSLVDTKGMITPQKFFNFMRRTTDAIDGRIETGASSLTPEQLSALWDINSHFRRQKSAFDLGNAVGESNTVQGSMDWVKGKATTLIDAGVHAALAPLGGIPNMVYKDWREKGTARGAQNKLNQRVETYGSPPPLLPRQD